jgi:hypothetical protein
MDLKQFTTFQTELIHQKFHNKIFLEGVAGSGKTTAGVGRLFYLLELGVQAGSILLLVPQRTLATPYITALRESVSLTGGMVSALTVGGLAQRMVDLYWPLVAEQAGFSKPDELPIFLTLETAQYYMAHMVKPLLDEGMFSSVTIDRNRLYSQVLDNLNKAAVVSFPVGEIGYRLKSAWTGEPGQNRIYDDVQTCANLFRRYCLDHNLLDYSLQIDIFWNYVWPNPVCHHSLKSNYRHLIFDNVEEDTPLAHDLLAQWLPEFDSALLIFDHDAGYRRFLGADPQSGYALKSQCSSQFVFIESLVNSAPIKKLVANLGEVLQRSRITENVLLESHNNSTTTGLENQQSTGVIQQSKIENVRSSFEIGFHRLFPQMLDWVAEQISRLVYEDQVPLHEIVIIAPFMSDALRFSLENRLQTKNIVTRSHRPSRSLREEPVTQCLFTLTELAFPQWGFIPSRFDVAYAFMQAIEGMDLVRARLLTDIVYHVRKGIPSLSSFDLIQSEIQDRLTYHLGERYEKLRTWLSGVPDNPGYFDHFISRLFGEILSQPGFGFHTNIDSGEITANLIESIQKFRWVAGSILENEDRILGKEYLMMVQDGVISAQYIRSWEVREHGAVFIAPAYTYLMTNQPVEVQFWVDVGSRGWSERLNQPLTHPYVLSRTWSPGTIWTDIDEVEASRNNLYRLVTGLLHRCKSKIYLGISEIGEQGYEQRGPLLLYLQRLLRQIG